MGTWVSGLPGAVRAWVLSVILSMGLEERVEVSIESDHKITMSLHLYFNLTSASAKAQFAG